MLFLISLFFAFIREVKIGISTKRNLFKGISTSACRLNFFFIPFNTRVFLRLSN